MGFQDNRYPAHAKEGNMITKVAMIIAGLIVAPVVVIGLTLAILFAWHRKEIYVMPIERQHEDPPID